MIEYLNEQKLTLLDFGIEILRERMHKKVKESDLSMMKDMSNLIPMLQQLMGEFKGSWARDPEDVVEVDKWLMSGGYEVITAKYRPDELRWMVDFCQFFTTVWNDIESYLPRAVELAIYHQIRGKKPKGCPNFCIALERALKLLTIRLEEPLTRETELKRLGSTLEEYIEAIE